MMCEHCICKMRCTPNFAKYADFTVRIPNCNALFKCNTILKFIQKLVFEDQPYYFCLEIPSGFEKFNPQGAKVGWRILYDTNDIAV